MNTNNTSTVTASQPLLRPAFVLFVLLTLVTGGLYPLVVTGVAQTLFADAASGSLLRQGDTVVGSRLIGQSFTDPGHFWSRPSATAPAYNAAASSGANLGPLNPALAEAVAQRVEALRAADPANATPVPIDLVTASASGLDPHISVAAARYQAARVARARTIDIAVVEALIAQQTEDGWLAEPRVNVLALNMALDMAVP